MSATRGAVLALLAGLAAAAPLAAQGSAFGMRGLGWSGRPVSGRTAGTAGALGMFDPAMGLNPATLTRWRSVAAWAVGVPTTRKFEGPAGSADLETLRFPLFGFAAIVPTRTTVGFSISDFLDRTWTATVRDTMNLRGVDEPYSDAGRSIGGISDIQVAVGYRLSPTVQVGAGFHYYLGSARLTVQRSFDNLAYEQVIDQSQTDFRGPGVGVGLLASRGRFELSLSGRLNGTLLSSNGRNQARTGLPTQLGLGLRYQPVPGVYLAGSAQYDGWSRANGSVDTTGGVRALDVWSLAGGVEVLSVTLIKVRTPLRVGYRWRRLPFTTLGEPIAEWGAAGGIGLNMARDRATVDIGFERGARQAGTTRESFTSLFVGLTIRP